MGIIAGVTAVFVLIIVAGVLFLRQGDDIEEIKTAAESMLASAQQEAGQWQDESGMHWSRQEDGSLFWWDDASGEWKHYD